MAAEVKVADILKLLTEPDRLRIIKDGNVIFTGYGYLLPEDIKDETVKRFRAVPEMRHKEWKEKNLMPPMEPDILPQYRFSDLEMKLYYDIHI